MSYIGGLSQSQIGKGMAAEAIEEIEAPSKPLRDRIILGNENKAAHHARPLKGAEDEIIGVKRCFATQPGLRRERGAQGLQAGAKRRHTRLSPRLDVFEAPPEALFAAATEVSFVGFMKLRIDVQEYE